MSWFKKEEKVHFVRDDEGRVVEVQRSGNTSRTPVSDALMRQARNEKKEQRRKEREEYRQAYKESYRKAKLERLRKQGASAGRTTLSDRINKFTGPPIRSSYKVRNNYNPFGSMFDTGMDYTPRYKKPSTKYKIVGGKAYPLGSTTKKKKKKTRSSGGYDMFDNWGFMK